MNAAWNDGILLGMGVTIGVVGIVGMFIGPLQMDWATAPVGLILTGVALCSRWSRLDRAERQVGS